MAFAADAAIILLNRLESKTAKNERFVPAQAETAAMATKNGV
jgi:hypothetical protein